MFVLQMTQSGKINIIQVLNEFQDFINTKRFSFIDINVKFLNYKHTDIVAMPIAPWIGSISIPHEALIHKTVCEDKVVDIRLCIDSKYSSKLEDRERLNKLVKESILDNKNIFINHAKQKLRLDDLPEATLEISEDQYYVEECVKFDYISNDFIDFIELLYPRGRFV